VAPRISSRDIVLIESLKRFTTIPIMDQGRV